MHDLWANPAVNSALVLLIIGLGGVLIKVCALWSVRLGHLINLAAEQTRRTEQIALTTTKTETLVNSQRDELKAEIKDLKLRLDASTLAKDVATETSNKLAVQVAKDLAAQMVQQIAVQAALSSRLDQAMATSKVQADAAARSVSTAPTLPDQADPLPPGPPAPRPDALPLRPEPSHTPPSDT